jgi:hypothetical protein
MLMDQALAEIWFSRDCNQAPDCASQLMQVLLHIHDDPLNVLLCKDICSVLDALSLWFLRRSAPFHPISVSGNAI